MVRHYIELDNGRGQKGYASYINLVDPIDSSKSADGTRETRISITKYPGRAMSYLTEDDAEKAMMHFEQTEGLNREEASIVPLIHDEIHELWLGGGDCPDGVAVMRDEKSQKRFLLIRDAGEEVTDDLREEGLDMLVPVLEKLRRAIPKNVK